MDVQLAPVPLGEVGECRLVGDPATRLRSRRSSRVVLTSWTSQPLPSGSLIERNEP